MTVSGVPHAFWNPGDEPARLLELISPPDVEALGEIQARDGLSMDMGSRESLMKEHGPRD